MQNRLHKINFKYAGQVALISGLMMGMSGVALAQEAEVTIGALVSGQVTKIYVTEGQAVKAGDKLLNLDSSRYQAKLALLKAQKKMAKLTLADAKIELDQALDLFDRTVTSKRTLDASQLRFDTAQVAYDKAKAEVALHQAWSKYVYIKAPIKATVSKIYAPLGTTVFKENTPLIELKP